MCISIVQLCKPREGEYYMQKIAKVQELEESFSRLWTECQRCMGSTHNDVLCSK
jgi:DNA polymerase delta subunit 1